jgi:hypothetical protein
MFLRKLTPDEEAAILKRLAGRVNARYGRDEWIAKLRDTLVDPNISPQARALTESKLQAALVAKKGGRRRSEY